MRDVTGHAYHVWLFDYDDVFEGSLLEDHVDEHDIVPVLENRADVLELKWLTDHHMLKAYGFRVWLWSDQKYLHTRLDLDFLAM